MYVLLARVASQFSKKQNAAFGIALLAIVWMICARFFGAQTQTIAFERPALRVQAQKIEPTSENVVVSGFGTIEASQLLDLSSQMPGKVSFISPNFQEGSLVNKGDLLIQLDPRDFEIAVESAKAQVELAENNLKIELGNHKVAAYEYGLFKKELAGKDQTPDLALRKPQLKNAEIAFETAKISLKKATLDLERTAIRAPFDALVVKKNVSIETYLFGAGGLPVAQIASTDKFFVKVRVPVESLSWLEFESGQLSKNNIIKVFTQRKDGTTCGKEAIAENLILSVEGTGRMAQILLAIPNPLEPIKDCNPFLLGSFVKAEITGKKLENVVKVPRQAVHEQKRLYVADVEDRFRIRSPEVLFETEDAVWFKNTLKDNDRIIFSDVQTPLDGLKLDIESLDKAAA